MSGTDIRFFLWSASYSIAHPQVASGIPAAPHFSRWINKQTAKKLCMVRAKSAGYPWVPTSYT
ncbi:hypothetical protein EMIT0324P_110084 [Pseudomonas chlororaphis]